MSDLIINLPLSEIWKLCLGKSLEFSKKSSGGMSEEKKKIQMYLQPHQKIRMAYINDNKQPDHHKQRKQC